MSPKPNKAKSDYLSSLAGQLNILNGCFSQDSIVPYGSFTVVCDNFHVMLSLDKNQSAASNTVITTAHFLRG